MAPCSDVMINDVITLSPDISVQDAMKIFDEKNLRSLPVVDGAGKLVGVFGLQQILFNLLPASVAMDNGLSKLDFVVGAAPGIAKRLQKLQDVKISDAMEKNPDVLQQDTPTWEGLRMMAIHGGPIPIVRGEDGSFVGVVTKRSMLRELNNIIEQGVE